MQVDVTHSCTYFEDIDPENDQYIHVCVDRQDAGGNAYELTLVDGCYSREDMQKIVKILQTVLRKETV